MMAGFLDGRRLARGATYLDVASSYGWFVAGMRDLGFVAAGVEHDELAVRCGTWVYGLEPGQVAVDDAASFLDTKVGRADVVSCFSFVHHLAIRDEARAVRFVQGLDRATGSVLFLDTGEAHEVWLGGVLPEWDPPFIAEWLRQHTSFARVVPLGTDDDRGGRNGDNYGRTLFACVR
jgi:hypothetical protein